MPTVSRHLIILACVMAAVMLAADASAVGMLATGTSTANASATGVNMPRASMSQPSLPDPIRVAQATSSPAALSVEKIRYHDHGTYTRVVLVLNGPAAVTETTDRGATTIALANSALSRRAQQQTMKPDFPNAVTVTRGPSHTVHVTLNDEAIGTYKLLILQGPDRVVVDMFYPTLCVVIDPGHGGKDPGAIGRGGTQEKTVVLQIAKTLRDVLRARLKAKVFLTRSDDVFLDLSKRVAIAKEKNADLFISIHANSHQQRSIQGVEIYYFGKASDPRALRVAARENEMPLKKNDPPWRFFLAENVNKIKIEKSLNFAFTVSETIIKTAHAKYRIKNHGVKTAPFHVLLSTPMPGILAEVGFISNATEEQRLRTPAFQEKLAEGIYQGIQRCTQSSKAPCLYAPESTGGRSR